ncbi:MAG: FtsK/SpoIIIE domain-containing protein [Chloroflexota bacterium]|nr:FtsK/SpoIIIE domain-containing protein [Chloroflexota bacterium]
MSTTRYLAAARIIVKTFTAVLEKRPSTDPAMIRRWVLTENGAYVWLFGVLDDKNLHSLSPYTSEQTLHHLSTALRGKLVLLSNTTGLRYAVLLSKQPQMPKTVHLPGFVRGKVRIGVGHDGGEIATSWQDLGHILVAGKNGSGKSTFNRLLVYQALAEGHRLFLADPHGTTFPMLADHPALFCPIVRDGAGALELAQRALGECRNRSDLFRQMEGYPEDLDEYNRLVTKSGGNPLPRLVLILDEFNMLADEDSGLIDVAKMLGREGRKFGVSLIFSSHGLTLNEIGRVRNQIRTVFAFRIDASASLLKKLAVGPARNLPSAHPGLAFTNRWGPVQTYLLDKQKLINLSPAPVLTEQEHRLVQRVIEEMQGKMSIPILAGWGMSEWEARSLVEDWEQRGWLKKDPQRKNARFMTLKLADIASNTQTTQTASNSSDDHQIIDL